MDKENQRGQTERQRENFGRDVDRDDVGNRGSSREIKRLILLCGHHSMSRPRILRGLPGWRQEKEENQEFQVPGKVPEGQ